MTVEKRYSLNTKQSYIRDITAFSDYCSFEKITDIAKTDNSIIKDYLKECASLGKSKSTLMRISASLRSYYAFLSNKGVLKFTPEIDLHSSSEDKKMPEVLSTEEIVKLLSAPSGNDKKSIRDKAMLQVMYATGIKVSELINLKLSDINFSIGIIKLGEGIKERIVPIYKEALNSLLRYIKDVRPSIVFSDTEELLFTNMSGQALSRQGFWKIVKHYAEVAKIPKDITPYTFRHSFATHLLENGADIKEIKEMLGHTDISTTNIYAQIIKSKYASSYKKYHPLAR